MGGLLILGSCIFSTLLWADLNNYFIWISLLVLLIYGTTGFVDDYVKVTKQTANAMTARMKLVLQFSTALIASAVISYATPEAYRYSLTIPYFRDLALNLCWFYIPFAMIVITGASNAVNLSDGLDGLASGLLICSFAVFMLIAYTCGTAVAPHFTAFVIPAAGEITVLCAAVIGGCLGFLWFNAPKAKVFMGDTGSLALGALLGTVAVMTKHEILLAIVGGVFVMETVSVMIQVAYFKKPAANASSKWPLFITILNSSAGPKRRSSSVLDYGVHSGRFGPGIPAHIVKRRRQVFSFSRNSRSQIANWWWTVDKVLLTLITVLIIIGIFLNFSASPAVARRIGVDSFHFVKRQMVFIPLAIGIILYLSMQNLRFIRRTAIIGYIITMLLMVMALLWGEEIKGASRWIRIFGFSLQPSEFIKPTFAVVAAWLFDAQKNIRTFPAPCFQASSSP